MTICKILETGRASAAENMRLDAELLAQLGEQPILRFYSFEEPSATYGHFLSPEKWLKEEGVVKHQLQLAKRPTGGGLIFHLTDFTFSFFLPASNPRFSTNTLDNYALVNRKVSEAIRMLVGLQPELFRKSTPGKPSFCMARPTIYDVMIQGRKVGGAAQRRTKNGFLHQASISLAKPSQKILSDLLEPELLAHMESQSYYLFEEEADLSDASEALKNFLIQEIC